MKLISLNLENFKGVRKYAFEPNGSSCKIYGANGVGKTTLADAYFWLLFGKDSNQNTSFSIKTNGTSGVNYSVTGSFELDDGQTVTLARTLKEKWERKRGESERKLCGNTTVYEINGVPKKQKEYKEFVDEICSEDVFSLLTNPDEFPRVTHWKARRDILMSCFASDITDSKVISSHPELEVLGNIDMTVSEFETITKCDRDKINKRLKELPIAINAYNETVNELEKGGQYEQDVFERLSREKSELEMKLSNSKADVIAEKRANLNSAKLEMAEKRNVFNNAHINDNAKVTEEISMLESEVFKLTKQWYSYDFKISSNAQSIENHRKSGKKFVEQWKTVQAETFVGDVICPTCHQPMPTDLIENAKENFNKNKSERLAKIRTEMDICKAEFDRLKQENLSLKEKLDELDIQIRKAKDEIEKKRSLVVSVPKFEDTDEYAKSCDEIFKAEKELFDIMQSNKDETVTIRALLKEVEQKIEEQLQFKANEKSLEFNKSKIQQCIEEQKHLSIKLAECDVKLEAVKEFNRLKALDIESRINSKFSLVKWKLFKQQVNGGIEDCCEACVDGISYNDGLNTASKVNAGLDIINVLSQIYNVSVPIWIDNAESVTNYIAGKQQRFYLVVSEKYKSLMAEMEN